METLANLNKIGGGYSTDEVRTGETWIDGKPIYRKCVEITSNFTDSLIISSNLSRLVNWRGVKYGHSTDNMIPYPASASTADSIYRWTITGYLDLSDTKFYPQIGASVIADIVKIIWIFEYTKTTD